ncbi:DUF6011 domain-containing protein [Streptomyces sp. NPDC087297]|uniref:DUF6011 domain-containing protein n=1 Tax=Streptomyces sp. NPDC087297 TaxID=3365778 RepID=UPI0038006AE2
MAQAPEDQTSLPIPATRHRPLVRCLDCGAPLTDSVSRRWGRGPNCRSGIVSAPDPGRFAADQDTLPGAEA